MNFQMEAVRINANQIHIYREHQKVLMVVAGAVDRGTTAFDGCTLLW